MTVKSDLFIPSKTECVIQAKIPTSCNNLTGMVCSVVDYRDISYCTVFVVNINIVLVGHS